MGMYNGGECMRAHACVLITRSRAIFCTHSHRGPTKLQAAPQKVGDPYTKSVMRGYKPASFKISAP